MRDWNSEGADHAARQKRALAKIDKQAAIVKSMNGHAKDEPSAQNTLNEMQGNKAVVDLNRALFDYEEAERNGS